MPARRFKPSDRVPDRAVPELFGPEQWRELGRALNLTPRQVAVARLVCGECTKSEMAQRLGVAPDTVGTHLKALFRALGARTRVGVVVRLVLTERRLGSR